jgi:hypothetical protein
MKPGAPNSLPGDLPDRGASVLSPGKMP